jgi:hypothetical protein
MDDIMDGSVHMGICTVGKIHWHSAYFAEMHGISTTRDTLVLWISLAYMGEEITKIGSSDFVKSSGEGYFALKFR